MKEGKEPTQIKVIFIWDKIDLFRHRLDGRLLFDLRVLGREFGRDWDALGLERILELLDLEVGRLGK